MTKFHVNPETGNPNICKATKKCRFGDDADHYESKKEARDAYESSMMKQTVDRNKELKKRKKIIGPSMDEIAAGLETPAGFSRLDSEEGPYYEGDSPFKVITLEGDGITIKVNLNGSDEDYFIGDGHVSFESSKGTRTFDRYGVEDSFYIENPPKWANTNKKPVDIVGETNATIRDFIDRKVPEARARIDSKETVPGLGLLVGDSQKKALLSKGTLSLTPSGFGTGYTFSTTPRRYGKPATAEQKKFFGASELWVETFDCD